MEKQNSQGTWEEASAKGSRILRLSFRCSRFRVQGEGKRVLGPGWGLEVHSFHANLTLTTSCGSSLGCVPLDAGALDPKP